MIVSELERDRLKHLFVQDQKMDLDDQKGDLEAASEALNTVIAAHRKHQQIQDSIVSELRRLADAQAAEMQTSARKLQEAQQQQQAIQTLLGRDDGSVGMVCIPQYALLPYISLTSRFNDRIVLCHQPPAAVVHPCHRSVL